jgi:hypothetical protein
MTTRILRSGRRGALEAQPAPRKPRKLPTTRILSEGPIGVTLVSPDFEHLAQEAVSRFRRNTGLECVVIHTGQKAISCFGAKLNLDLLLAPRPIVFFDADLWIIRPVELTELATSGKWCAVPDPCAYGDGGFPAGDVRREGWDPNTYFNSGFFACDLSRPEIRRVFSDARAHLERVHAGDIVPPVDSTDQFYLNWAVQQQPGLFHPLPLAINFFQIAIHHGSLEQIPAKIIGLHAAGVPLERKLAVLGKQAAVYGPPEKGTFHARSDSPPK